MRTKQSMMSLTTILPTITKRSPKSKKVRNHPVKNCLQERNVNLSQLLKVTKRMTSHLATKSFQTTGLSSRVTRNQMKAMKTRPLLLRLQSRRRLKLQVLRNHEPKNRRETMWSSIRTQSRQTTSLLAHLTTKTCTLTMMRIHSSEIWTNTAMTTVAKKMGISLIWARKIKHPKSK